MMNVQINNNSHSMNQTNETTTMDYTPPVKLKKITNEKDDHNDIYCFECHTEGDVICCEMCPRVYHLRCLGLIELPPGDWMCPECETILSSSTENNRPETLKRHSMQEFHTMLTFALRRMKSHPQAEPFMYPVDTLQMPEYLDYIVHPMDLKTMEKNIEIKKYASTEAFIADVKWIYHNCVVFNGGNSKFTSVARSLVKIAKHEMNEISICPECYLRSVLSTTKNWFCEPCHVPHPLVWSKMKGFPFWPAKVLRIVNDEVDVRFFGQHDRAWVNINNCLVYSQEYPGPSKRYGSHFENSMQEVQQHIERLTKLFGGFTYAPLGTPLNKKKQFKFVPIIDDSVPASYVFDTVRSTSKPLKHRLTQQRDNPLELNSSSNNLINNKRRHERSHSSSQQEAPKRARLTSKCLGKKMNKKDNTILRSSRTNIIKIENNDNEQSYTNGHSSIHDEHDTDDDNCQRQEEANNSTIIQREKRKILKQKSTNNDIDSPELNTTNNSTKTSVELGDSSSNNVFDLFEEYDEDGIPQQTSVSDSPLEKVSKEGTSISIPMKSNISNSRMKTKMNGSITSTAANAKQFANQHSLLVPSATSSISPDTKMHIHALLSKYIDRSVCVDPIEMNVRHTIDALLSAVDSLVSSSLSNGIGSSMKMSLLSSTFEHTTKLLDIPSPSSTTLEQDAAASISKELQSTNTNFISSTCDNERLAAVVVLSDCLLPNHSSEEQQLEQKKVEPLKLNHTTPNIIPQRMTLKHSRKSRQQQRITTPSVHNVNNSMLMHNQVQKTVILNDYSQEQLPKQVLLSPNTDSIEHPSLLSQISTTKQQPVTVVQDTYTDSSHLRVRPLNGTSASFESIDTQNVKSEPIDTIYERISPLAMAQSPPSPTTSPTITKSVSQLNFETRSNREHHLLPFGANQINSTISSKTIHPLTNTMHSRNTVRPTINGSLTAATRVSDTTPSSFQQRYTQQQPAIRTTPTNVRTPASSSQRMDSKTSSPSLQFSDYQSGSTIHNPQQQQSRRSSTVNYTATSTSPSISLSPSNRHFVRIPPLNNCPIRATTDSRTSDEIQTIINNFSDKFQHMMTEFSAQIDAALETNRRRYEKELDETRRAYRTSINELRSITTQQVNEMRTSLELQYWNRMSDMRNRYEHTLQQMKTSSKSSNIPSGNDGIYKYNQSII